MTFQFFYESRRVRNDANADRVALRPRIQPVPVPPFGHGQPAESAPTGTFVL